MAHISANACQVVLPNDMVKLGSNTQIRSQVVTLRYLGMSSLISMFS